MESVLALNSLLPQPPLLSPPPQRCRELSSSLCVCVCVCRPRVAEAGVIVEEADREKMVERRLREEVKRGVQTIQ